MNKERVIDLFEFGGYKKLELDNKKINELKSFLQNIWENRKDFSEYNEDFSEIEDNQDEIYVSELKKQPFLSFDGSKIRARNYIGFIEFEDYRLNIYPKIFKNKNELTKEDKKEYFKNILYWFSYCKKIKFPFNQLSTDFTDFENILELFIFIFASYTEKIISEKPYSRYHEVREETTYLRGSIAISEYTRENLITGRWHHFYCNYEPFIYNNIFNQIVKYVTRFLLNVTENENSKSMLENILFVLDEVDDVNCVYSDCNKVSFNRLYEDLDLILTMCKMFLSGQILDSFSDDKKNFCFLLPMEKIFEEFIFNFIVEEVKPELDKSWNFKSQASDLFLTQEKIFNLKHDILCENLNLIIDTKYKIRNRNDKKCGISQNDMYQMVSYAIRRGYKNVLLIYPQSDISDKCEADIFTVESKFDINQKITIKAINLNILEKERDLLKTSLIKLFNEYQEN